MCEYLFAGLLTLFLHFEFITWSLSPGVAPLRPSGYVFIITPKRENLLLAAQALLTLVVVVPCSKAHISD